MKAPIEFALAELVAGVREFPDPGENPRIGEYLKVVGLEPDDETSWCSAFIAWCHEQAQVPILHITGAARSWLQWGHPVEIPRLGDVVVLWRGHRMSWQGHVGLYVGGGGGSVILVGGNQGNAVSVAPFSTERVLGYRRRP